MGRAAMAFRTSTFSGVPKVLYFLVAGPFIRSCIILMNSVNSSGFATFTSFVPRTATAFRFLDPITAPIPVLPAALNSSFMMEAIRTSFSPASPIADTRM